MRRGFRRTHYFAEPASPGVRRRSPSVSEVITCRALSHSGTFLPETEDEIELRWEEWLDHAATWAGFFQLLAVVFPAKLVQSRHAPSSSPAKTSQRIRKSCRGAEQRAVPVPGEFSSFYRRSDHSRFVPLLAARLAISPCLISRRARRNDHVFSCEGRLSFTIIKCTMRRTHDLGVLGFQPLQQELDRLRQENFIGAASVTWSATWRRF